MSMVTVRTSRPASEHAPPGGAHGSSAAERSLVLAAQRDRRERDRLVEAFMPLVGSVARRYHAAPGVDRAELMQEGVVGLLRALKRYDPSLGTPFWAYAQWWVRQAMQQLVSELAGPMVLSDRASRQLARVRTARRAHQQAYRGDASTSDLSADTGLPSEQVDMLIAAEHAARSLQEPQGADEDGGVLGDTLADAGAEQAYERATDRCAAEQLPALLDVLTGREQAVLTSRFGLGKSERTLRQIGTELGVSAERVRQVEHEALEKLRLQMGE
jgi:RNA polymerase primary sigma factor